MVASGLRFRSRSCTSSARLGRSRQVHLVEEHAIGEGDLLDRLVFDALGLLLVEVLGDVLGVDHGDDCVDADGRRSDFYSKWIHTLKQKRPSKAPTCIDLGECTNTIVDKEGLADGGRICHSGRFHDDPIESVRPLLEFLENLDQVAPDSAAYTAIRHIKYDLAVLELQKDFCFCSEKDHTGSMTDFG